jgi:hypothetical protein
LFETSLFKNLRRLPEHSFLSANFSAVKDAAVMDNERAPPPSGFRVSLRRLSIL